MAELRATGLTYREIGERLGVTRQCVHGLLNKALRQRLTYIACCVCRHTIITGWRGPGPDPVFCVACLPSDGTFGQRLRAHRVAKGLTAFALGAKAGVSSSTIIAYELGKHRPNAQNRAKVSQALGVELPCQRSRAEMPMLWEVERVGGAKHGEDPKETAQRSSPFSTIGK
jgi:transcriptional regulator with XRE-family HTH domain